MIGRQVSRFSVMPWTSTTAGAPTSPAISWASSMAAGYAGRDAMMAAMSLVVQPEVADALRDRRAVVTLESTIISHGMPFPENVEMATEVEQIVRHEGAVPATIAVLDGRCHVGLDEASLHVLATSADVIKATTRDLPFLIATRRTGATTVAATMRIADLAGIRVFATGGIGGVHRADGITGQEVTPYLLSHVVEQTGGRSLAANIALVRNNAALTAQIAGAYSGLGA